MERKLDGEKVWEGWLVGEKFMDKNYKLKKIKDKIYILFFLLVCVILLSINLFW